MYGGVCALNVSPLNIDWSNLALEFAQDQDRASLPARVSAGALVLGDSFVSDKLGVQSEMVEIRSVSLGTQRFLGEDRAYLAVAPSGGDSCECVVHGVQLDGLVGAAPKGKYVLHLTTLSRPDEAAVSAARGRLGGILDVLAVNGCEWTEYFTLVKPSAKDTATWISQYQGVYASSACGSLVTNTEELEIDMDGAFARAKVLFASICPGNDFLPASQSEISFREEEKQAVVNEILL